MKKVILLSLVLIAIILISIGFIYIFNNLKEKPTPQLPKKLSHQLGKEECESRDGKMIGCETLTGTICSLPTSDGGKKCSDNDECEQECVAPSNCKTGQTNIIGTCAERTNMACNGVQRVENGTCDAIMIN